jgi:hypothetical protein
LEPDQLHDLSDDVRALAASSESSEGSATLGRLLEIAERRPNELIRLLPEIGSLIESTSARISEASLQTIALVSRASPTAVAFLLPRLHNLLSKESTETVSEQVVEILSNYGRSSKAAAERVLPIFRNAIAKAGSRTLKPLSKGLSELSNRVPEARKEIGEMMERLQRRLSDMRSPSAATGSTTTVERAKAAGNEPEDSVAPSQID